MQKWGKRAKYGLVIKEKTEMLEQENFEKRKGNQLKRETFTFLQFSKNMKESDKRDIANSTISFFFL